MARVTRTQFNALAVLYQSGNPMDQSGLEVGDVLIHNDSKQWAAYKESGPLASFHASMMIEKIMRVHALPDTGVMKDLVGNMGDMAIVFRLEPALLHPFAGLAAQYAENMVGVPYSRGRAVAMPFVSKSFGSGAKARLDKYATDDYGFRPKHVVCSELIILAYQFAMDQGHQAFMDLDAKYSTPADLESYFLNHGNIWELVGRIKGSKVV
jgi:hypothetical protein